MLAIGVVSTSVTSLRILILTTVKATEKPNGVFSATIKNGPNAGRRMDMFVYRITEATPEELNAYSQFLASQGYKLQRCETTNLPLYMHTSYAGVNIDVQVSPTTGRAYVVNFEERKLRSLAKKNGIEAEVKAQLAVSLAEVSAKSIISNMFASRAAMPINALATATAAAQPATEASDAPVAQNEPVDAEASDATDGSAPF